MTTSPRDGGRARPPQLRVIPGGRHGPVPYPRATRLDAGRRAPTPAETPAPRVAPFARFRESPPGLGFYAAFAAAAIGWIVLGWSLITGVLVPLGSGSIAEGTRRLFAAVVEAAALR